MHPNESIQTKTDSKPDKLILIENQKIQRFNL